MRELRKLLMGALALTFLAGIGVGAWVGSLRADPERRADNLGRRVEDWQRDIDLDPAQVRRLREILARYDARARDIRAEVSADQVRRISALQEKSRQEILSILTPEQRATYDKLVERR